MPPTIHGFDFHQQLASRISYLRSAVCASCYSACDIFDARSCVYHVDRMQLAASSGGIERAVALPLYILLSRDRVYGDMVYARSLGGQIENTVTQAPATQVDAQEPCCAHH